MKENVEVSQEIITPLLFLEIQNQGFTSVSEEDVAKLSESRKKEAAKTCYKDENGRYGIYPWGTYKALEMIYTIKSNESGFAEERLFEHVNFVNKASKYYNERRGALCLSKGLLVEAFDKLDAFITEKQEIQKQ